MHPMLSRIKAVGFDLDRTLYIDTPEINDRITNEIVSIIIKLKPELGTFEVVKEDYIKKCALAWSSAKVLEEYGIQNSRSLLLECFDLTIILDLINRDEILIEIINSLFGKYFLFLITGSPRQASLAKLQKLGIDINLFNFFLFGDNERQFRKSDKSAFEYLLSQTGLLPKEHIYIGDNVNTDVLIPKSLGIMTIAVGYCLEADFQIEDIHEIRELLL